MPYGFVLRVVSRSTSTLGRGAEQHDVVEKRIEHNLIAGRARHDQRSIVGQQRGDTVLPPQLLTVDGFVVVAIVGVNSAIAAPRDSCNNADLPTPDIPVINTRTA